MTPSTSLKRKRDGSDEEAYLSDESDFYGSPSTKHAFEKQAQAFNTTEFWAHRQPSLIEIAALGKSPHPKSEASSAELYNPYQGLQSGRQLEETIDQFLSRLPPATTSHEQGITPWIFIANPFRKRPDSVATVEKSSSRGVGKRGNGLKDAASNGDEKDDETESEAEDEVKSMKRRITDEEGPLGDESNWAEFVVRGNRLLQEMTRTRHAVEKEYVGKAKQTITKKLAGKRDELVQQILGLAAELKCTSGKWMIFAEPAEVNAVWRLIAQGTASGELGSAAKVATDSGGDSRKPRLICVYNADFTDVGEVKRIVRKLKEYGVVGSRGIYYKCCAYTYLGLNSQNDFGIKASMYSSAELLANGDGKNGKLDFFPKKKKGAND